MDHEDFQEALATLGLSPRQLARLTGKTERTIRRYALGEERVPRIVELVLLLFLRHPGDAQEFVKAHELLDDEL